MLATLEEIEPEVRWHDGTRSVEYALFSKSGFTEALHEQATDRTDCHLFDPEALLPSN